MIKVSLHFAGVVSLILSYHFQEQPYFMLAHE